MKKYHLSNILKRLILYSFIHKPEGTPSTPFVPSPIHFTHSHSLTLFYTLKLLSPASFYNWQTFIYINLEFITFYRNISVDKLHLLLLILQYNLYYYISVSRTFCTQNWQALDIHISISPYFHSYETYICYWLTVTSGWWIIPLGWLVKAFPTRLWVFLVWVRTDSQ